MSGTCSRSEIPARLACRGLGAQRRPSPVGEIRTILAEAAPDELGISDVTLTELARLLAKGTIRTALPAADWLKAATVGLTVLPVTVDIALRAAFLDWEHRDPCDRHIVATAAEHKLPLLTIDGKMHHLAGVRGLKVIW